LDFRFWISDSIPNPKSQIPNWNLTMPKLTILIPCKDEAQHVRACIESVRPIADEILIADSGSRDGTLEVVRGLGGCRIIEREYVNSADFKNWAIPQAAHEWVLVVDADERVTPGLAGEIQRLLATEPACDGYSLRRDNFFLGHAIRHCGWNTSRLVRLFRKGDSQYETRRVHANVIVASGKIGELVQPLVHHTALDLDRFVAKQERYATWSSLDAHDAGKRASWVRLLTHAPLRFLQLFLLRGGCLDGRAGIVVCGLAAWYTFLKDAKLWAMRNCRVIEDDAKAGRLVVCPSSAEKRAA
jgi:glycosyltransferase involved in cell wall biosynthesis